MICGEKRVFLYPPHGNEELITRDDPKSVRRRYAAFAEVRRGTEAA